MAAVFTYAVRYWVQAECTAPLRTGGDDTEQVLTREDGRCILQGSSVAGALRAFLEASGEPAEPLFGSQEHPGSLIVSDGVFEPGTPQSIRPRLRINGVTGSADKGGKFDIAQVDTGSRFRFELTWTGKSLDNAEIPAVERLLSAMDSGAVCLGAQKSNGFGRVKLSVKKKVFDMRDAEDRNAWLNDLENGTPLALSKVEQSGLVTFTLTGQADSILVKAAAPEYMGNSSYTPNLTENGCPILPGSSVKGAVRARAALIAKSTGKPEALVEALFGRGADKNGSDNGLAGRVRFEDVRLDKEKTQKISRIRINRFTGGVMRGGLFTEEPLCSKIRLRVTVPADQPAGCALLLYALRDLGLGLYNLGSGGAVGRGFVRVDSIEIHADGRTAHLTFGDKAALSDPDNLTGPWMSAWKEASV